MKINKERCVEFILTKEYGSTIDDLELARILNFNITFEEQFRKYKIAMITVKNKLMEYGYILKSVHGVGYYILKPENIPNHCYKNYIKRGRRSLDKSLFVLEHMDRKNLKPERLDEYNQLKQLNESLIQKSEELINNSVYMSRMEYYNSLND